MKEIWRGLKYRNVDYSNRFEISNFGNLRRSDTHKLLKTNISGSGYLSYCASMGKRGKYKLFKIHRAVAENFIPNPNSYPAVNHIDGNKQNNRFDNLEWCTYKHNAEHAHKAGLSASKEVLMYASPKRKPVRAINLKTSEVVEFPSIMEAARKLGDGKKSAHITRAVNGDRKSAYGYKWELISKEEDGR